MSKKKLSPKIKVALIERYKRGECSCTAIARSAGIGCSTLRDWIRNYDVHGPDVFLKHHQQRYTADTKEAAVRDYLDGKGSQAEICRKYGILSSRQLRDWIMKYNSHEKLKSSGTREKSIVTKGRKTTFEERISIVEDCIANGRDYIGTAVKFDVSYQQVYTWVRKYDRNGLDGLRDGRGHRKPESEMSELERIRYENRILKAQLTQQQMEIDFLKKLEELERR